MGRVVVGVDGSACSYEALAWAADEARLRSATLTVVCAYEVPAGWLGMGDAMGTVLTTPISVDELERHARSIAEDAARRVEGRGLKVATEARLGHAAAALMEAAEGADLLVVGNRGHGDIGSVLLGSVGMHCVHHADCPVVVVRSGRSR